MNGLGIETGVDLTKLRAAGQMHLGCPRAARPCRASRARSRRRAPSGRGMSAAERYARADAGAPTDVPSPCISVCVMDADGVLLHAAASARWTRSPRGACSTPTRSGACWPRCPRARRRGGRAMIADWYFDFVSPFAYLQSEQLASLAPRVSIRYRPVLFAGLLGANGQKGPAEIPAKRAFTYRFCLWQAKALGIPLRVSARASVQSVAAPAPRDRVRLARPTPCIGSSASSGATAACPICRSNGRSSRASLGVPDADARIATAEVKDELRRNTDEAIARGVFGVPTLAIGDELFWGADATAMAADYVAAGCRFDDPEYARVAALPVGARARRDQAGGKPRQEVLTTARMRSARRSHAASKPASRRTSRAVLALRRRLPGHRELVAGELERRRVLARAVAVAFAPCRAPRTARSSSASSSVATGVTQQSTSANRSVHSASVAAGEDRAPARARTRRPSSPSANWPGDEIGALDRRAQRVPELLLQRADGEPAPVARRVDAVARNAAGQQIVAARRDVSPLLQRVQREDVVRERRRRSSRRRRNGRGRCAPRRRARPGCAIAADAAPPSRSAICRLHSAGGPSRAPVWSSTPA